MEWIFDGVGTAIISGILGAIVGGTAGYRIGVHKKISVKQKQKAGNNSNQIQIGNTRDV
ncbi:hypothetical protein [Fibrobacter sp.]|uniref:hypothetical protein n=1 Tax=Fibrobacter sp. TaxID=35828 RepID=UPI002604250D|nr:hypothetical protein [Fibrobacter sp.]MDD5943212.1 hypothetical protein [Fibrobacter sp.]